MKLSITNAGVSSIITVSLLAFIPFAIFVPRQFGFKLLDAISVALSIGGSASYFREAWLAMRRPLHKMLSAHYIVVGVFFAAVSMGLLFAGMLAWRVLDQPLLEAHPEWIINSIPILFTRWLAVIALVLFMLTTYSRAGVVVVGAYKWPTAITIVAFIAVLVIWRWF